MKESEAIQSLVSKEELNEYRSKFPAHLDSDDFMIR